MGNYAPSSRPTTTRGLMDDEEGRCCHIWQLVGDEADAGQAARQRPTGGLKNFSKYPDNRGGTGGVRKTQF